MVKVGVFRCFKVRKCEKTSVIDSKGDIPDKFMLYKELYPWHNCEILEGLSELPILI